MQKTFHRAKTSRLHIGRSHSGRSASVLLCATVFATVFLSSHATADDAEDPYDAPGFYVGASGLYTHNFFDAQVSDAIEDEFGGDVDVAIEDSWGVNARLGYRVASWFAIEAQYEYVNEFDVEAKIEGLGIPKQKIFTIEGHTLTGNARFIVPVWRVQPYMLVGAGYSLYESDVESEAKPFIGNGGKQDGFAGRAGGGLDFYLTPHIVLNAEVTGLVTTQDFSKPDAGQIDELWYISAGGGLRYQF